MFWKPIMSDLDYLDELAKRVRNYRLKLEREAAAASEKRKQALASEEKKKQQDALALEEKKKQ